MYKTRNKLYEIYHLGRKRQKKIIGGDDFTYLTLLKLIKKYLKDKKTVIDIGCGTGAIDFYMANMGKNVTGIDISQNGIKVAKQNCENFNLSKRAQFYVMDFSKFESNKKFDVVICSEVLEHIKNDYLAVRKIYSLLNTKGVVIASSPSENAPLYRLGVLNGFDKKVGHLRRYTESGFKNLFEKNDFDIIETIKTEGFLRNFLFTNQVGGTLLRLLNKRPFSKIITWIDNLTLPLLGESNIYVVAQKK